MVMPAHLGHGHYDSLNGHMVHGDMQLKQIPRTLAKFYNEDAADTVGCWPRSTVMSLEGATSSTVLEQNYGVHVAHRLIAAFRSGERPASTRT